MRLGLVGYGNGGRHFHAPHIEAADGIELAGVVARSEQTRAAVHADLPEVPVHASLSEMLASGVDAAERAGVVLSVFHNRRFDADLQTLAAVLESGRLGHLQRVHSRFDLDQPEQLEAGPQGGLLRDLGTHLVDQMLWLLGPVVAVSAQLDEVDLPEGRTDSAFLLALRHASGTVSYVSSTKLNHLAERELRAYGANGSYTARSSDVQAEAIFAGHRPVEDKQAWGFEPPECWGTLRTAAGAERIPSEQGAAFVFYEQFARACAGTGPAPSPGSEGVAVLEVLDAARRSAAGARWEPVP